MIIKENLLFLKFMWLVLGLITLSAIVLINNYTPYIPDYDGLSYFEHVKIINNWLFGTGDLKSCFRNECVFWPIANGLSAMMVAVFRHTLDINLLPTYINALYLLLFAIYLTKIRSAFYAYGATLLLCGHTYFYRLFTTLTSEFSVGLWIFAFLLTLTSKHERRGLYLSALIVLGLLLRTIDIVFILCAVTGYSMLHYLLWKDRQHVLATLRYIGLTVLVTAPLFFLNYKAAFAYVKASQSGISSVAWKAMADVFGGWDVPLKYVEFLTLYNSLVITLTALMIALGLHSKSLSNKSVAIIAGTAFATIFPLLMASTINIMTAFWVFAALIFIVCEVGFNLLPDPLTKVRRISFVPIAFNKLWIVGLIFYSLFFLRLSWGKENQHLKEQKRYSEIAFEISAKLNTVPGTKYITTNYWGIGAFDNLGLSWDRRDSFVNGKIKDIYSKNKNASDYLNFDERVSFFISAHENYFFPLHFGINDHTKEINDLFTAKSSEIGFKKVAEVARNNTNFDIWYRPTIQPHLQYSTFDDNWISTSLPIDVGSKALCADELISGKLHLSVNFPNPNLANFTPPFLISLVSKESGSVISSAIVNNYGDSNVELELQNIACGEYKLSFDKAFSVDKDSRKLSAIFIRLDSVLRFDQK